MPADTMQTEVFALLRNPAAWPDPPDRVDVIETHGALVFLAGNAALKVKRAVRLPYLDFSTLEARRRACQREIEINRPHAPDIYRDVIAITRLADGCLAIAGSGEPVEWAVRMNRFAQDDLLSNIAERDGIEFGMARLLAGMAASYHRSALVGPGAVEQTPRLVTSVLAALRAGGDDTIKLAADKLEPDFAAALARSAEIRHRRAHTGYVRRCHGDLHLGNIVLQRGRPVPFDAIEFDETLAAIDTLYDLAFLLMDLERRNARPAANLVLNQYLWQTGDPVDLEGLAAMPVFLGLRAAIRAMVALDRKRIGADHGVGGLMNPIETLALAERLLRPPPARLVAIGGLSGTGKTTLAAALAPAFGAAPGALHLRTDLERKWLAGVGEFEPLPASSYTAAASKAVYSRIVSRAWAALRAGHCVIVDGVFARSDERCTIARLASDAGAAFQGLWLEARPETLRTRVANRDGDASDATPAVVDKQLSVDTGPIAWTRIDSSAPLAVVRDRAMGVLAETRSWSGVRGVDRDQ